MTGRQLIYLICILFLFVSSNILTFSFKTRYHGDCVGVSQSLSKKIRAFYCHICRKKKSSLSIKYKSKFQDFLKLYSKPTTNRSKLLNSDESFVKFLKETKVSYRVF